jgi:energy-coupling factor transporter ATP-binding protein EcfA2
MPVTLDFLSGLYNRHSCYADRLTPEQIEAIHVPTRLEVSLRKWLQGKKDIVLLGNPGDGKTHLLRHLQDVIDKVKAEVVLDATAEKDYERIVRKWKAASDSRRPFCLAINQGPLNRLLALKGHRLPQLEEVAEQIRSLVTYDNPAKTPRKVFVVDLNLRSVLTGEIILHALNNLLTPEILDQSPSCFADETSDAALNRKALLEPHVQDRLVKLLTSASYAGRHVSMRDIQGFLSYILLGGRPVSETLKDPSNRDYRYFNLAFQGEGELFDAVRDVFEPERATTPEVDEHLWENTGVREGWLFERPPLTPDYLVDAWEQFTTLKRQYFFEHADGDKLLAVNRDDNATFFNSVSTGATSPDRYLPTVLKAINAFYCPERNEEGSCLRLWGAQQYDGHTPRVLVSCYQIPKEKFVLQVPKLAPWLADAMDYRPDHVLLRYTGKSTNPTGLRIDRGLWRALALAAKGLPMSLRSPQYSQSIQTFITKLYRIEAAPQPIETVYIYSLNHNRVTRVMVDRQNGVYVQT